MTTLLASHHFDPPGIGMLFRPNTWDRGIIEEVFADNYGLQKVIPKDLTPSVIVDIGAHVGAFSALCYHLWPNANIVAVEPEPSNFEVLKQNLATNGRMAQCYPVFAAAGDPSAARGQAFILRHRRGCAPRPGEDPEVWGPNTGGSFVVRGPVDLDDVGPELELVRSVEVRSLKQLVKGPVIDFGDQIHLLKIDAEGAEIEILEHADWPLGNIPVIVGECHSHEARGELVHLLADTHRLEFRKSDPLTEFIAVKA